MKKMTEKSLTEAFTGESIAHMKYIIFSEIAEKEGFLNIARLFRAISYAEQVHATNHARNLGLIKKHLKISRPGLMGKTTKWMRCIQHLILLRSCSVKRAQNNPFITL